MANTRTRKINQNVELNTTYDFVANDGTFSGTVTGNSFVGPLTGDVTGTVSSLSNHDTADLAEGTNLYFTTARARASFSAGTGVNITSGVISIGQSVSTASDVTFGSVTATTFSGALTGDVTGNADTASALEAAVNIALTGSVTGNVDFDGSGNISITTTTNHNHDDRYYTETESDGKYLLNTTDTLDGNLTVTGDLNVTGTIDLSNADLNIGAADIIFDTTSAGATRGLMWNVSGSGILSKIIGGGTDGGKVTLFANINDAITTGNIFEIKDGSLGSLFLGLSHAGILTAGGGTSTQWNTAYTYSQVGHLPLAGGTLTGTLNGLGANFTDPVTIYDDASSENPRLSVGREAAQSLNFGVEDRVALIYHVQDEVSGGHSLEFSINSPDPSKTFYWLGKQADGTSPVVFMTLNSSGITASGYNKTNWDTAYGWGNHAGLYASVNHTHIISPISETAVPSAGISIQAGPGGNNTQGWTHPYGTRLSAIVSGGRSFEIMSTTYPNGELAMRTLDSSNVWDAWKTIIDSSNISSQSVNYAVSAGAATTSITFVSNRTNYKGYTDNAVAGQLMWKNYGNNHTIFDASAGTSPSGTTVSRHTPDYPVLVSDGANSWGTNANLMGWNGSNTYGVKVDWSRYSETSGTLGGYAPNQTGGANTIVQRDANGYIQNSYFYTSGGGSERNGSGMGYVAGFNSSDYYIRSYTMQGLASAMSGVTMNINGSATTSSTTTHYASRTDGTWYNAVWAAGNPSHLYSADAVQIQSSTGSIRANVFYDNNDTAYYLDPNSTGVSLKTAGNIISNGGFGTNGYGSGNLVGRVYGPKGATYSSGVASVTGAIKIKLPIRSNDTMWSMKVRIYNYISNATSEYLIGNYSYSAGAWNWAATYFGSASSAALTVRLGNEGGYDCVWIGETSTGWQHPVVSVMDFMGGYANGGAETWDDNWDITFVTSFGTIGATISPDIKFSTGEATSSFKAPIFYDSNNTGYYLDPASGSNLNQIRMAGHLSIGDLGDSSPATLSTSSRITFGSLSADALSNYSIGTTIENYGGSYNKLDLAFHTGIRLGAHPNYGGVRFFSDQTMTTEIASIGRSGNFIDAINSMRSPIFYDSNDTTYYADPASTSNLNFLNLGNTREEFPFLKMGSSGRYALGVSGAYTRLSAHPSGNGVEFGTWDGSTFSGKLTVNNSGDSVASTSLRAPIFYDSNDTGYYLNPNGFSNLHSATFNANWAGGSPHEGTINIRGNYPSMMFRNFVSNTAWLRHMDGAGNIQHYYVPDGYDSANWSIKHTMQGDGTFFSASSMRSPIFYDSDNTGYYTNPASTSNLNSILVNGSSDYYSTNYFYSNKGGYSGGLDSPGLQVYSQSNNSAFMSFHKGGHYAVNMGLDADNVLRIGGWSAASNRLQLNMSGNLTVAGDVTAYSDARVKENVITIDNALDKVLKTRGVYYNRIDSEDKKTKVGVIAQEILEVIPEVVNKDNHGMYNVSYGNITAVLIEAMKEQQKQIEELKAIVNGLTK